MALDDAGLVIDASNAERVGVMVGSGIGGLPMIEDNILEMGSQGSPAHLAVLRSGLHHQHGRGTDLDPVRRQGAQRVDGVGVHDELALRGRRAGASSSMAMPTS